MSTVYVLVVKWPDNSGFRILRVYNSKDDADEALDVICQSEPAMAPQIIEVQYVRGRYE